VRHEPEAKGPKDQEGQSHLFAEERDLVNQAKHDPKAFGKVYDAYFDSIFNYILHRMVNVALTEDLTAQTFMLALKNLWKFKWCNISISSWLFRIATNEVNAYLRKQKRATKSIDQFKDKLIDNGCPPDLELLKAEESLVREEEFLLLHSSIQLLKHDEQALIVLRYFESKSFAEIAKILNKREGSLRMRNKRALEKLKIVLNKRGIINERDRKDIEPGKKTRSGRGNLSPTIEARTFGF